MPNSIRIAVIDDHPLMRSGIEQCLATEPDFEIVAQGESADAAVQIAENLLPDVILIDINMPGGGLAALERIAASCPAVATIVITVREDVEAVSRALRIGARGYVLKGVSAADLVSTVRAVAAGDIYITPQLAARLLSADAEKQRQLRQGAPHLDLLTARETEILDLIAKGMINREIATVLDLREKTVKHYVTNILQKLQVRNRVEAALMASRNEQ